MSRGICDGGFRKRGGGPLEGKENQQDDVLGGISGFQVSFDRLPSARLRAGKSREAHQIPAVFLYILHSLNWSPSRA